MASLHINMAINSLQYYSRTTATFFFFSGQKIKAELFRIFNTLNYVAIDDMQNLMF